MGKSTTQLIRASKGDNIEVEGGNIILSVQARVLQDLSKTVIPRSRKTHESKQDKKKSPSRHVIVKLHNTKETEKIFNSSQKERQITYNHID